MMQVSNEVGPDVKKFAWPYFQILLYWPEMHKILLLHVVVLYLGFQFSTDISQQFQIIEGSPYPF